MTQTFIQGKGNQTNLAFDELRQEPIPFQDGNGILKDAICDICFIRTSSSLGANIALYLCYSCNTYVCQGCFKGHESHRFIKKDEKERMKKCFRDEIMKESVSDRKEMLDGEEVAMVDRVNVKHELDMSEDCWISGLCGLDDTRWVVCDIRNFCIKIFSIGSHILQSYIRFGSEPFDVTEIKLKRDIEVKKVKPLKRLVNAIYTFIFPVKREPIEQGVMPITDIFVTNQSKLDKQCMIAVTLPWKRRILIINVTNNSAVITKSIETEKHCHSIEFDVDKIFTLCCGDMNRGPWLVYVMSTDGVTITTINPDLHPLSFPSLAVCSGRFYITEPQHHKVLCIHDKGKVVIELSLPRGISVDPNTNQVYICVQGHDTLYRLDSSLESSEPLFDFKSVNLDWPKALCLYRDRLYVSHGWWSTHDNFVTVVRVL